jgi:hypothetical protein
MDPYRSSSPAVLSRIWSWPKVCAALMAVSAAGVLADVASRVYENARNDQWSAELKRHWEEDRIRERSVKEQCAIMGTAPMLADQGIEVEARYADVNRVSIYRPGPVHAQAVNWYGSPPEVPGFCPMEKHLYLVGYTWDGGAAGTWICGSSEQGSRDQ